MKIMYPTGDATRPVGDRPKIIIHVCNDAGGWGKGFVVAVSRRWPQPEKRYRAWHHGEDVQPFALREVQFVKVEEEIFVTNLIGQHGMGVRNGVPLVRYDAIRAGCCARSPRKQKNSARQFTCRELVAASPVGNGRKSNQSSNRS